MQDTAKMVRKWKLNDPETKGRTKHNRQQQQQKFSEMIANNSLPYS